MVGPDEIGPAQCLLSLQEGILDGVEDQHDRDAELVCRGVDHAFAVGQFQHVLLWCEVRPLAVALEQVEDIIAICSGGYLGAPAAGSAEEIRGGATMALHRDRLCHEMRRVDAFG